MMFRGDIVVHMHVSCASMLMVVLLVSRGSLRCESFAVKGVRRMTHAGFGRRIDGEGHAYCDGGDANVCGVTIRDSGRLPWSCLSSSMDPLEDTKRQYERLTRGGTSPPESEDGQEEFVADREALYGEFISYSANALKAQLKSYNLKTKGRKPDLATRLVEYVIDQQQQEEPAEGGGGQGDEVEEKGEQETSQSTATNNRPPSPSSKTTYRFASLNLSPTASQALSSAQFTTPTPIQSLALPLLANSRQSLILHAETGSGKTLCYLLPITERMWEQRGRAPDDNQAGTLMQKRYAVVITPTRELAAQVAGVASVLAPPNSVRLVTHPTNLVRDSAEAKERAEGEFGGRFDFDGMDDDGGIKLIVGSAKTIMLSIFGDGDKFAASPTSKPEAKMFLKGVEYLVLDEVDRMLDIKSSRQSKQKSKYYKKHDKPAAILAASIARQTFGKVQIVAASATVGRPLRREYARILGLLPKECPPVIKAVDATAGANDDGDAAEGNQGNRMNTLPKTLNHYFMPCDGSTSGGLLTVASFLVKGMQALGHTNTDGTIQTAGRKILFVITKKCGITINHTIGAMNHFNVQPQPKALLDLLDAAEGTDKLIGLHKEVTGVTGLGQSPSTEDASKQDGYVLVTGEDSVRGLHLDGLDSVIIVGRPSTPDSYIHIAGRAGRAGRRGSVVNIVSFEQGAALTSWETMLGVDFMPLEEGDAAGVQ